MWNNNIKPQDDHTYVYTIYINFLAFFFVTKDIYWYNGTMRVVGYANTDEF